MYSHGMLQHMYNVIMFTVRQGCMVDLAWAHNKLTKMSHCTVSDNTEAIMRNSTLEHSLTQKATNSC